MLGRVARAGLSEEVTYLGLQVPLWRGITHQMGLDWELLKAPVTFEEGRNLPLFSNYWRGDHPFSRWRLCQPSPGSCQVLLT